MRRRSASESLEDEIAQLFRGVLIPLDVGHETAGAIEQIQASLKLGASYETKSFMNGAVAYAAVLALQDPTFVASVRSASGNGFNVRPSSIALTRVSVERLASDLRYVSATVPIKRSWSPHWPP